MNDYFLADDLSGALDAAAAFHHAGGRVRIVLQPAAAADARPGEVVAMTTETRNSAPAAAAEAVRAAIVRGQELGGRLLYKKIDSTLRGSVAAELHAVRQALPKARVLFAPANPRVGRTVKDGVLLVRGVPVAETEFGRDPACPLRHSAIRDILGDVATDRIAIPDTTSEAELDEVVQRTIAAGGEWIAVGSGALAVAVAKHLTVTPQDGTHVAADRMAVTVARSGVLMIGGSAHPLNRTQADALARSHNVTRHEVALSQPLAAGDEAARTLKAAGTTILHLPHERTTAQAALSAVIAAAMRTIGEAGVRRVFATGGETAYALCDRLGVASLEFVEEIEPGLSLSTGRGRDGAFLFAVKPGGFGDERTWIRAWERLKAAS